MKVITELRIRSLRRWELNEFMSNTLTYNEHVMSITRTATSSNVRGESKFKFQLALPNPEARGPRSRHMYLSNKACSFSDSAEIFFDIACNMETTLRIGFAAFSVTTALSCRRSTAKLAFELTRRTA